MSEERVQTEIVLEVPGGYTDGGRLDVYITGFVLNATRSKVQRAVKEGHVRVNGRVESKPSYSVTAGDVITCTVWKQPPIRVEPEAIPLDIVHEDSRLIVVNKAAGMVVHPAYGHRSGTLVNALLHHVGSPGLDASESDRGADAREEEGGIDDDGDGDTDTPFGLSTLNRAADEERGHIRPGIVHRLDKDTSGLMVVAKDDAAHVFLARQFEVRTIHRTYEAILWGHLPESGEIDAPIGRSPRDRKKMAVVKKGGKEARTHYKTLRRWEHLTLVEFRLETGRTHQIRVHAAHLGHPVLGDTTYGGDEIKHGPDTRNRRAFFRNLFEVLARQALHARELEFVHPDTGELVRYTAATPPDMMHAIERLEKDR